MSKELLQQALDALKFYANPTVYDADSTGRRDRITFVADDAIIAIESAIAQPVPPAPAMPEFHQYDWEPNGMSESDGGPWLMKGEVARAWPKSADAMVPLTRDEIATLWDMQLFHIVDEALAVDFVRDVEKALGIKGTQP